MWHPPRFGDTGPISLEFWGSLSARCKGAGALALNLVSVPDPFPIFFIRMRNKGGGGERKGSGDTAYPSADPGRNAAVGVKYAISNSTTTAVPLYYVSTALLYSIIIYKV